MRSFFRQKLLVAGLFGNIVDHYDTALYGFLAPVIAPLIFPDESALVALIKTYGLMSASLFTRPLGAWFFGLLGARYKSNLVLSWSLGGLGLVTFAIGLLPTHNTLGDIAPLMLALLRLLQGFFAAGEATIAPFFVLQLGSPQRRGFLDSIYNSTTVLGELIASLMATLVLSTNNAHLWWRLPFLLGGIAALVGVYIRFINLDNLALSESKATLKLDMSHIWKIIQNKPKTFLRIIAVSGMSYITYAVPFVLFNGLVPKLSSISLAEMMASNTWLLLLDMLLAPFLGWLSDRIKYGRFMALMAFLLMVLSLPLFLTLQGASLMQINIIRIIIVLLGLGFCAPLHAWFMTQYVGPERYLMTGIGYAIGSQIFGRSTPTICLMLYANTGLYWTPALYLMLVSGLALWALFDNIWPLQADAQGISTNR
jgi:MFS family permease